MANKHKPASAGFFIAQTRREMQLNETQKRILRNMQKRGVGANHPRVLDRIVRLNANRKEFERLRGWHRKPTVKHESVLRGLCGLREFANVHGWEAVRNLPKAWRVKVKGRMWMVTRELFEDWSPEWQERMFPCR